jgi:hypothetical protein
VGTAPKKRLHGIAISTPDEETKAAPAQGQLHLDAIQPAPTAEHQHREGLSFWQAIKTMFK